MSYKQEFQSNNTDLQTILSKVNALPSGSALGDATAADVVSGKTFSSASGIKVAGTLVPMEILTGTLKGSGSITLDDGRTGSCLSGLPVGKKNVLACALKSYSSNSTMYHVLFVDGKILTFSSYRQHDYFDGTTTSNITLDTDKGKINSASTVHFPSSVSFRYYAW